MWGVGGGGVWGGGVGGGGGWGEGGRGREGGRERERERGREREREREMNSPQRGCPGSYKRLTLSVFPIPPKAYRTKEVPSHEALLCVCVSLCVCVCVCVCLMKLCTGAQS